MKSSPRRRRKKVDASDEHTIPPVLPYSVLRGLVIDHSEWEERDIKAYVESQTPDEQVVHLERVKTEHIFDRRHDVWDVRTDKQRYWVITAPTNLYPQDRFASLDYAISLHVGVTTRVMARADRLDTAHEEQYLLAGAFRRWQQAAGDLDRADEAEHFQAVGSLCRSCLLELVRSVALESMVPEGVEVPQRDNFVRWSEIIADAIGRGSSAERVRGYLKSIAKETWQLVSWLVHAENAARFDGRLAVDATGNVLQAFGAALVRYARGTPDRCAGSGSYRLRSIYRPDLDTEPPFAILCESCGATAIRQSGSL